MFAGSLEQGLPSTIQSALPRSRPPCADPLLHGPAFGWTRGNAARQMARPISPAKLVLGVMSSARAKLPFRWRRRPVRGRRRFSMPAFEMARTGRVIVKAGPISRGRRRASRRQCRVHDLVMQKRLCREGLSPGSQLCVIDRRDPSLDRVRSLEDQRPHGRSGDADQSRRHAINPWRRQKAVEIR